MTTHIARAILAGFILTGALAQALANDEAGQSMPFRILPQALDKALMQFSDQSGIQLVVTADTVRGKSTKGVTGTFEPTKALAMLLEDSGLQYQMVNPRSFAI